MNVFQLLSQYGTQEKCLSLLELARWGEKPACPYCQSEKVSRHAEKDRQSRWQCSACQKSYSVTVGTIFHHTHTELPIWFAVLNLMLNAKKSLSSHQVSRETGIRQPTILSLQQRIRKAMATDQGVLLKGIVEMDETYIGGKPRNKGDNKRGRGTSKLPIIGAVERDGSVRAEPVKGKKVNFATLSEFVQRNLNLAGSVLVTDEYKGYNGMVAVLPHSTVNHSIAYVFNDLHTNTIEGFWSLLKRAWYGSHHHYSKEKSHLYIGEACYKYNNRKNKNTFSEMVKKMLSIK